MLRLISAFILSALMILPAQAMKVNGVDMDETVTLEGQNLVLNGAGVRVKWFVKGYVAGLYLQEKSNDAEAIINADAPMAVRLVITSSLITPERMSESTRDGFVRSTQGNIAPIEAEIDGMISAFKDKVEENDVFDLVYVPGTGVEVFRNGERKATVAGMEFKKAMFGIWLSKNNIQKDLKKAMVGQ